MLAHFGGGAFRGNQLGCDGMKVTQDKPASRSKQPVDRIHKRCKISEIMDNPHFGKNNVV
ncbi:hypothetical protein D3C80_2146740 [compost metagenome]